jgi:hypothetical protein
MTSHNARRQRLRRRTRISGWKLVTLGAILGLTVAVVGIPDWLPLPQQTQSQQAVTNGASSGDALRWSISFPVPSAAQPSQ